MIEVRRSLSIPVRSASCCVWRRKSSATTSRTSSPFSVRLIRTDRLSIEQRLDYLGFPPGAQDGFFDSSTRWAIEGYQRDRGFEPNGYLSQPVLARLVEETGSGNKGIVIDGATVLRNLLRGLGE